MSTAEEVRPARRSRGDTRERILDAAMDVFAEHGFSGATISEVERRVGLAVGTGSLNRHFASKEELLREAVNREVANIRSQMQATRALLPVLDDPLENRKQVYRQVLHDVRSFDRLFRLMLSEGERVPSLREAISSALAQPLPGEIAYDQLNESIAMAALCGYHVFSMMQGHNYDQIEPELFITQLASLTQPRGWEQPPSHRAALDARRPLR